MMAGYLQRFFEGPGIATSLAPSGLMAPAHRPTSPLFTPDQQIAHMEFESGEAASNAIADEVIWPDTPSLKRSTSEAFAEPMSVPHDQEDSAPAQADAQAEPSSQPAQSMADAPAQIRTPEIPESQPQKATSEPRARAANTDKTPASEAATPAQRLSDAESITSAPLETVTPSPIAAESQPPQTDVEAKPVPQVEAVQRILASSVGNEAPKNSQTAPQDATSDPLSAPQTTPQRQLDAEPSPSIQIRPIERAPAPLPQPTISEPDWKAIDARINAMVSDKMVQQAAAQHDSIIAPEPSGESTSSAPHRPMTAAEASVIGKISAAKRPIMIFGTRMR